MFYYIHVKGKSSDNSTNTKSALCGKIMDKFLKWFFPLSFGTVIGLLFGVDIRMFDSNTPGGLCMLFVIVVSTMCYGLHATSKQCAIFICWATIVSALYGYILHSL